MNGVNEDMRAREALDEAALVAGRMHAQSKWDVPVLALLGLVMFALVAGGGLFAGPGVRRGFFGLALMALLGLVVYTASRKVIPRHHKLLYWLTPVGALLFTVTVVLGPVFFDDAAWWWVLGAALSTLPFWVIIAVNLAVRRER